MVSESAERRFRPAKRGVLAVVGPGLAMAATGVGAGDLAGAAFAGSKLGVAILWAVLLGALFKYVITEGFGRWQLATGTTILEGAMRHLGLPFHVLFGIYLCLWSFTVGSALISACGVSLFAILPMGLSAEAGKIVYGVGHSLMALALVLIGRYELFEKVMGYAVGLMFATVLCTAVLLGPDLSGVLSGLFVPSIPRYVAADGTDQGVSWTLALMGGVGGTVTILCYGYWIREKGWEGAKFLRNTRIDLGVAYLLTALFGMSMVLIASRIDLAPASSSMLIVALGSQLGKEIGSFGESIFLAGAWAAMFTSLLGVWQAVPYLFADFWQQAVKLRNAGKEERLPRRVETTGVPYRVFLLALALVPIAGTFVHFEAVQKTYALSGSLVIPSFAGILLYMNNRRDLIGRRFRNGLSSNFLLALALGAYLYIAVPEVIGILASSF